MGYSDRRVRRYRHFLTPFPYSGLKISVVYFHCRDCAIEASRVSDAGGRVDRSKMSIGEYGFIFRFAEQAGRRPSEGRALPGYLQLGDLLQAIGPENRQ